MAGFYRTTCARPKLAQRSEKHALEPDERRRRAEQARRAYFARLSLAAVKARQAKRTAGAKRPEDGTAA